MNPFHDTKGLFSTPKASTKKGVRSHSAHHQAVHASTVAKPLKAAAVHTHFHAPKHEPKLHLHNAKKK